MVSEGIAVTGLVTVTVGPSIYRGENLVVTTGLARVAAILAGTAVGNYYVEVGTGTTAVASGDTALVTPDTATWRLVAAPSSSGATLSLETIYTAALAVGTWTELGLWSGANATAGSGTMLARVLLGWSKTSAQVATVSWSITFTT